MKTIIAPTDFSQISLNAVNYAADLATSIGAALLLVNIVPVPISVGEFPVTETLLTEMEEDTEKALSDLTQKLLDRTENKIKIQSYSEIGTVEFELEEICKKKTPFAIVMSTKNSGAFERFFIGSNTLAAVHNISYPVLTIPETSVFVNIKKVAFACNLEENLNHITINIIKEWLSLFNASLDVINVTEKKDIGSGSATGAVSLQSQLSGFHPVFHYANREKIEQGVSYFVEDTQPDLLIVVPKSRSIFHKSHSKPFILHSKVPVLAIPEYA